MDEKRKYEIMLIIDADLTDAAREKSLKQIKKILEEHKCSVFHEEVIGIRDLAYSLDKREQGYYVVMFFEAAASENSELEKDLKLDKTILRHLISKVNKSYEVTKSETNALSNFTSMIEDFSQMAPSEYEDHLAKKAASERKAKAEKK